MAEYKITVDFGSNSQSQKGYQSSFSPPVGDENGSGGNSDESVGTFAKFVTGAKALGKAIPGASLIKSTFDWQISLVGRYTGSQQAQAQANAVMKIAGQVGGVIGAFATGGPIGGLLAIGAVGLSYAKEVDENTYARKWENIGIRVSVERAGPSLNRSRSGN